MGPVTRTMRSNPSLKCWLFGIPMVVVALQIVHVVWNPATSARPTFQQPRGSYAMAMYESLGFLTDVPESEWALQKQKLVDMYPNVKGNLSRLLHQETGIPAAYFYQTQYEPDFSCRHERRLGVMGDGGKWVCDPHRLPKTDCLVYSVGSSGEASFEDALRQFAPQCEIHTFDMDASYANAVERAGSHFHAWGIADISHETKGGQSYKTLADTMRELSHEGRTIDILKLDCEGCEWSVAPSLLAADIRQLLIELHAVKQKRNSYMPMPQTVQFFHEMYKHGYVIFHKEVNIQYWHVLQCIEYGFLKLHTDVLESAIHSAGSVNGAPPPPNVTNQVIG